MWLQDCGAWGGEDVDGVRGADGRRGIKTGSGGDLETTRPGSRSPSEAVLLISASGTGVRDARLTHLARAVLQPAASQTIPAMNSFPRSTRLILPPGAAFWLETGPFPRKTPPPFPSGAALDATGAEFPLPGASLAVAGASLRRMVAPPFGAGTEFLRPGAPVRRAGAAVRRSGAAPISCTEAPAACSDATFSRSEHPAPRGWEGGQGTGSSREADGLPLSRARVA